MWNKAVREDYYNKYRNIKYEVGKEYRFVLKIIRMILQIVVIVLAGYSLITQNFELMPFMMLFLGAFLLVMGCSEFKKGQKWNGYMGIIVPLFILFVSIQDFILN